MGKTWTVKSGFSCRNKFCNMGFSRFLMAIKGTHGSPSSAKVSPLFPLCTCQRIHISISEFLTDIVVPWRIWRNLSVHKKYASLAYSRRFRSGILCKTCSYVWLLTGNNVYISVLIFVVWMVRAVWCNAQIHSTVLDFLKKENQHKRFNVNIFVYLPLPHKLLYLWYLATTSLLK